MYVVYYFIISKSFHKHEFGFLVYRAHINNKKSKSLSLLVKGHLNFLM